MYIPVSLVAFLAGFFLAWLMIFTISAIASTRKKNKGYDR